MLRWTGPQGDLKATGRKGTYTIASLAVGRHRLTGNGHDSLPMLALPPAGREFLTVDHAKDVAERLEYVQFVEPEASGS